MLIRLRLRGPRGFEGFHDAWQDRSLARSQTHIQTPNKQKPIAFAERGSCLFALTSRRTQKPKATRNNSQASKQAHDVGNAAIDWTRRAGLDSTAAAGSAANTHALARSLTLALLQSLASGCSLAKHTVLESQKALTLTREAISLASSLVVVVARINQQQQQQQQQSACLPAFLSE